MSALPPRSERGTRNDPGPRVAIGELAEALDNVTAALETMLTHFRGGSIHDRINREKLVSEARALLAKVNQ